MGVSPQNEKAMKKIFRKLNLAALVIVGAMAVGCTGALEEIIPNTPEETTPGTPEKTQQQPESKTVTLTTTISIGTETKALNAAGEKTFAVGEKVALVYKNTGGTTVKVESTALTAGDITNEGRNAKFSFEVTAPDKEQDVTYIYPAAMAKSNGTVNYDALAMQDGTLETISSNLDLATYTAAWVDGTSLPSGVLENQLTIGEFTVKESAGSTDITSSVTRLTIKNGSDIYTVTPSSLSTIWVIMKPVTTGDITIYAAKGKELYKKTVSGKTLAAGSIYPVNVTTTLVTGAVSGLFRIGDNLVYFSQGNLRAIYNYSGSSWSWAFAANQWSYVGNAEGNTAINGNGTVSSTKNVTVDLFGWVGASSTWTGVAQYGISNSTTNSGYGNNSKDTLKSDWGNTIGSGWRTPSIDEIQGVFNNHTYGMATVNGIHGVILLPYNTTVAGFNTSHNFWSNNSYSSAEWTTLEAAGAVFLPATGYRYGSSVYEVGNYGYYWSSSLYSTNNASQYYLRQDLVRYDSYTYRYEGHAVRLIGE